MRFRPTSIQYAFACFFIFSIVLNLACSKDTDLLLDSVIEKEEITSIEKENNAPQTTESEDEEVVADIVEEEEPQENLLEIRTTSFSPTNDAHYQSGKAYNQSIIRLDEGNRTSYLMFDLSPIAALNGEISEVTLQFTVESDNGSGSIIVFKANSSNWSERDLSDENIPQIEVQLGSLLKEYKIGETEIVSLDATALRPEISTLILDHKNGNDLAIASKEHTSQIGPKLVVSYRVVPGTEEIIIPEVDNTEETVEEETNGDDASVNAEPIAIADATPSSGGVPLNVTFTGSNSTDDKAIASFNWDFKDGSSSTDANPSHTFTNAGVYQTTLTVTDAEGLTTSDTVTITVSDSPNTAPKAVVSAVPTTGEAPLDVTFKGSSSTDDHSISSYAWNFKDGSSANSADLTHTYDSPGTYQAELTVTDENGLTDKATITINVTEPTNSAPIARTSANTTQGEAPLQIQFTGSNSTDDKEITGYSWDFKDGSSSTTVNPVYTFENPGTYVVELTVNDEEGLSHKNTITIRVTEPAAENDAPVARVTANPTSGNAPLTVQFTGNQSSDDNGITSYLWNFKDGSTATSENPSHTFTQAGNYVVDLTVTDADGASNTKSITINVNTPSNNTPPGFYVATNGNSSNSGTSPSSPWSLEHAFFSAQPGDIIYIKAGNYGAKEITTRNSGNSSSPIKFIGYKNTPGDVSSSNGSTFEIGQTINSNAMPLLSSSNYNAIAFRIHDPYIHIENIQINGYGNGINSTNNAVGVRLKNIILTNQGNQNDSSGYDGFAIALSGNNSIVEDCFVLNSTAQAITLKDSDNTLIKNCAVYARNSSNPTDYYYLLSSGTANARVENSLADRGSGLSHGGHGFNVKDDATYNTFKNCIARRTNFEFTYSQAHHNIVDGGAIYGEGTSSGLWQARLAFVGGTHHNTVKGLYIQDTWAAITWTTFNNLTGLDANIGNDNTFENLTVKNTGRVLGVGGGTNYNAKAKRNKFLNCNFENFESVAVTYYESEDIEFRNSSFKNGQKLVVEVDGVYAPYSNFDVSWINCTWQNVNFTPPN